MNCLHQAAAWLLGAARWMGHGTTPADWLAAVALGVIVGGLAGAGF